MIQRLRIELAPLHGLWSGFETDLLNLGIRCLADLRGRDPAALAEDYRRIAAHPDDPLLETCFAAAVGFAETGQATPWWRILRARAIEERARLMGPNGTVVESA